MHKVTNLCCEGHAGTVDRRRFLLTTGAGTLALTSLSACDLLSTDPTNGNRNSGRDRGASGAKEAPGLQKLVKAGKLPRLAERLPKSPLVVTPVERVGAYGGDLTSAILGPAEAVQLYRIVGYEYLMRWSPQWKSVPIPNIATSVKASPDARQFTFALREGMRWSNGDPFTAHDIVFVQNDVFNNLELYPAGPTNAGTAQALDDHTVRFTFDEPNGLFLQEQASTMGLDYVTRPSRYLKRFHAKYNRDVAAEAKKEKFAGWTEYFSAKADRWVNPDLPTVFPWRITQGVGEGTRVVLERNPYYWKVDPDGRQLPYIDRVVYSVVSDPEVLLTHVLAGDIDFQLRPTNTLTNKPVLARRREQGHYRFSRAVPSNMNTMVLCLNLTHGDRVLRDVFRNRDFRIGLSLAINRKEIIDTAYQKQGKPYQAAPRPESEFYDEKFATQYTEYDVAGANQHLDRVLPDKDDKGFRLRPDGRRLEFTVEFANGIWPEYPAVLELIRTYATKVGVDLTIRGEDRALFDVRTGEAQKHDAAVWQGAGGWNDIYLNPYFYLPASAGATYFGRAWWDWYLSGGKNGEEPPEPTKRQLTLFDQLKGTADPGRRTSLMKQILAIAREEFYTIGINLQPEEYATVNNRLRNVPDTMPNSWVYPTPGPTNPEQYFIS
ncbi:peptide/nickel transport system substrate-binding protein [Actinopolymorpha cephalotaxi]|uniref:Peptide/nickel transport system substrate-binding protein n=1 Tax=Actinopolymorpha cephalotaxi TaxID=504797 RepID=A0A1I2WTY3_9ACTN|nr:peptide/nickel transport system substrate-binding protein [Actinopolymorpha cephalotaxi]